MKQKSRFLNKIKEVSTAVFFTSTVALKGQKSPSFSGFSGGGGVNSSSKNKPSELYLSLQKTKKFSNKKPQFQTQKNTKKTRRVFFKFSLNTTILFVTFKLFNKAFRFKKAKFNTDPTKPQDVFKLIKKAKAHNPTGTTTGSVHSISTPCDGLSWPSWPSYPVYPEKFRKDPNADRCLSGSTYAFCVNENSIEWTRRTATSPPCPTGHTWCSINVESQSWNSQGRKYRRRYRSSYCQ